MRYLHFKPVSIALVVAVVATGLVGPLPAQAAGLSDGDARRFLAQASFGATESGTQAVMTAGRTAWLQQQFSLKSSAYAGYRWMPTHSQIGCPVGAPATCQRDNYSLFPMQLQFFANALSGEDQLRQRVALALSEILVASGQQIRQPYAMAQYQQIFLDNAFGNFRTILRAVTLSPAMGNYLNMANNDKPNPARGTEPNENYAREVLQLFGIGLWQLNAEGSTRVGPNGLPLPSYDQQVVEGFAHVFTGWTYPPLPGAVSRFGNSVNFDGPMVAFDARHDPSSKRLLGGAVLPAGQGAVADLDGAINNIFNHANVGPFIGRQLIQQLVTSNPSPAYVARVTAAFNGSSASSRGDMKAVVSAILLDPEAARPAVPANFGKLREPVLQLTHLLRALGGQSDGVWLRAQAANLGQSVFSPATVFGFFAPDFNLPEHPALDGPAFSVYNANTAFVLSGVLAAALNPAGLAADPSVVGSTGTRIDLTRWQALAANPTALINEINRVLLNGAMSPDLHRALERAVLTQPASNPLGRARAALFLAVMSPEYLVEH